ncbi:MAG: flagellar biosynthesis protein FliQ [candidate division FCPU426 bacterium]
MSPEFALDVGKQALILVVELSAPILLLGLLVGVLISIMQSVTQIQEMTLTFVPKIIVTVMAMIFFGPWMLRVLMSYTIQLYSSLPDMAK